MAVPAHSKKKKRSGHARFRKYWWLAPVFGGVIFLAYLATGPRWIGPRVLSRSGAPIKGYISDVEALKAEYQRFQGKKLKNPQVEQRFNLVNERIAQQDYESAAIILESVAQDAAVPLVFNDLGVVYAQLNDRSRSVNAFREALARDIDYKPVRVNLDRLRNITANAAEPVSREIEPNNTVLLANFISLGRSVEGEITPLSNDVDYYRLTAPPAPRDRIQVIVEPHAPQLWLELRIFDSDRRLTQMTANVRESGKPLVFVFGPQPNTVYYLEISGAKHSAGSYTLKATPLHAFDGYEPNDEIFNSRQLIVGRELEANIMDGEDTDYYSFIAPRTGAVNVTVRNRSTTLIPALTTFSPEMRNTGFGPDIRTPGATLRHTFEVVENQTYFLQVWSENSSAGDYTLIVE